ncbi:CgeB family protein [Bacillus cereus]|uniref:Spore maturation protein CgeB n=1 Tax=Bacillus mycoides TaxID=1405 RepID=C2XSP9_BACMY|nr:glycosyltransferase [Bacillus mycoides]EEL71220.1 Spore maturation protein CgeB [Bacillus mycoides]
MEISNSAENFNVLFVTSSVPVYFPVLEESIYNSLKKAIRNVTMVTYENLVKTALKIKPAIIIVFHGFEEGIIKGIQDLKQYNFKTALWLTDDPYFTDVTKNLVLDYDYVFTQDTGCIDFYKDLGCDNVYYLPLAAEPPAYTPILREEEYIFDISFIGTAFDNRLALIDSIAEYLVTKNTLIIGCNWDRLKSYELLKDKILLLPFLVYENSIGYYKKSKINMNIHRSIEDLTFNRNRVKVNACSINNRTFEIASTGSFQMTDIRSDLEKCYIPGVQIETFTSAVDFIEKAERYLSNPAQRKKIAMEGLKRTLIEHTYDKRVQQLLKIIEMNPKKENEI